MTDSELKQIAIEHAERLLEESDSWAQLPGRTVVGFKIQFYNFMLLRIKQALQTLNTKDERGVWYPENSRNKSYKFICSACFKIAYCPPKIVHKKGIGDVKCCSLKYCPHCGREMILRETIDEQNQT